MRVVRCHQFAAFEEQAPKPSSRNDDPNRKKQKKKPRLLLKKEPLPLRRVLKLHYHDDDFEQQTLLKPNDVLIETYYVGIMYPDALQAQGLYQIRPKLPYVPGMDLSGIVKNVGSSVKHVTIGDRVIGVCMTNSTNHGALMDYVVLNQNHVYKLPSSTSSTTILPLKTVANIGRNYFAAYHSLANIGQLTTTTISDGENYNQSKIVLITGSSGGVGMATIELAKAMTNGRCKIIAGVSSESKADLPKQVGADIVLTYGKTKASYKEFKSSVKKVCKEKFGSPTGGVDLVIDMVQGLLFETLISVTKPLVGKIVLVGFASGRQVPIRPGLLLVKEISVVGSLWGRYAMENPRRWNICVQQILNYMSNGQILPRVDRVFDLEEEYYKAFELYQLNQGKGNTVICMKSETEEDNNNNNNNVLPQRRSKL